MEVVIITGEAPSADALALIPALLAEGIARIHLRWPGIDASSQWECLSRLPAKYCDRLCLHQHHEQGAPLGIHWLHTKDGREDPSRQPWQKGSRACHSRRQAVFGLGAYQSLLLSPVFPPLSKAARAPAEDWLRTVPELAAMPGNQRHASFCALGGITPERLRACKEAGFDEVASLGYVWQAANPLSAAKALLKAARECDS